jgi:hypothetical protein
LSQRFSNIISSFKQCIKAFAFLIVCCLVYAQATAQAPVREYQVKAVFLYNFTQFVEWPPSAFNGTNAPFVIGILGPDPFGGFLDETVAGEKMNGHPMVVQRYTDLKDAMACHILFINLPNQSEVLTGLNNRSTLTVSDKDNFARIGGMIRFFTEKNKIRLQINPSAAKAANLIISSKLLRVAEIIE